MKNTLFVKFIAILLCAACLLAAAGSAGSLLVLGAADMLDDGAYDRYVQHQTEDNLEYQAYRFATDWAAREYGNFPEDVAGIVLRHYSWHWLDLSRVCYTILDENGETLESTQMEPESVQEMEYSFEKLNYEQFLCLGNDKSKAKEDGVSYIQLNTYDPLTGALVEGTRYMSQSQTLGKHLTVKLFLAADAVQPEKSVRALGWLSNYRSEAIGILAVSLLLFAALAVFLCSCAGCKRDSSEIRAGGFSALPLDLYGGILLCGCAVVAWAWLMAVESVADQLSSTIVISGGVAGYLCCLAFVCYCFAFAAQVKMGHFHWLRNTATWRCMGLCWRLAKIGWKSGWHIARGGWKIARFFLTLGWKWAKKAMVLLIDLCRRGLRLCEWALGQLPLTWQWIVIGGALALWLLLCFVEGSMGNFVLWCFAAAGVILYGANAFGALLSGAKRMRGGDLESKVEERYLVGTFREFAQELNGLADVAVVAAQKQLKSERMKTELITNVSHDIKTPLTSIINYVDLLQKPHTPQEEKAYLEVLSRQSNRLKKLIEDLIEMSKASTGNIQVEISQIDAVEAVTQALGEFADKLSAAGLTLVLHHDEEPIYLLADGRLLWRAVSNVLSNAVKYAMPGTRLYVDVSAVEDKAVLSFKNISGAQLNISAEELMERFVRGDSSRNTEGSGLGLNIAKSLMELQKGQLQLLVDGDLFKVTLLFPRVGK